MMRSLRLAAILTVLSPLSASSHLVSQSIPARAILGRPAELPEGFNVISALAELPVGRVLVSDLGDQRIILLDFSRGTASDAARIGSGPTEFRSASPMIAAPGGEVWSWDVAQDRILVFDSTGSPRRTRPANMMGASAVMPMYADARGRVYGEYRGWRRDQPGGGLVQEDSTAIVRTQRGRADTIALIHPLRASHRTARDRGMLRVTSFAPQDAWGVFSDGTVLVVRGDSYTPEMHGADGSMVRATPIPFTRMRVTEEDRRARAAEMQRLLGDARRSARDPASARQMNNMKLLPPERWEETKPAIREPVILVDSRNRAWVEVFGAAAEPGLHYDLLDKSGRRVDAIRLPKGEKLIGFGRGTLYTVRRADDEFAYVRRYPLP